MAPPASPRKMVVGMMSMPASASTTVTPLKNTARFAVAPDARMASSLSRPRCSLLPVARHDEQRVVDPDREAHHRDEVRGEERELPDRARAVRRFRGSPRSRRSPMMSGVTPATAAPNTSTSTIRATTTPMDSPTRRSSSEIVLKSSVDVTSPSVRVWKPAGRCPRGSRRASTCSVASSSSPVSTTLKSTAEPSSAGKGPSAASCGSVLGLGGRWEGRGRRRDAGPQLTDLVRMEFTRSANAGSSTEARRW